MISLVIALIFASKISLEWTGLIPREKSFLVFQGGLHPYFNLVFTLLLGGYVWFRWAHRPETRAAQSKAFKFFLLALSGYLVLITTLQILFKVSDQNIWVQGAAAFCSVYTIYLFGRVIPSQLSLENFWSLITRISVALTMISLMIFILGSGLGFKGYRFVGVFKHIPHMVTCATLSCFGLIYYLYARVKTTSAKIVCMVLLLLSFFALILTGTRSASMAVLLGFFLCLLLFKTESNSIRIVKFTTGITALLIVFFFGHHMADQAYQVMTGEKSLGARIASDGIQTRREEFTRGLDAFKERSVLGTGLLSKFNPSEDFDFKAYNSFKDPHNILMSAGVVGGWGLIVIAAAGLLMLLYGAIKGLFSKNYARRVLAILVLTHIPILFIYHIHVSIGGFADRIYWMLFGYLALIPQASDVEL